MEKAYKHLINFFENNDCSWDKSELINDYCGEVLEKNGFELPFIDEYVVADSDGNTMAAEIFAEELFNKILVGVCNVIVSFAEEENGLIDD